MTLAPAINNTYLEKGQKNEAETSIILLIKGQEKFYKFVSASCGKAFSKLCAKKRRHNIKSLLEGRKSVFKRAFLWESRAKNKDRK